MSEDNPSQFYLETWKCQIKTQDFHQIVQRFQQGLLAWFKQNGRDLPWRNTRDPYKILLSELMLQQTQVDRVIAYYHKFLERFPDFEAVANAKEEEIIQNWEGLGYYNRARNLQKTAKIIVEQYNHQFPTTKKEILALPGLGEYTVGAVMTFALEQRHPIVDTNVERVIRRVFLNPKKLHQLSKTYQAKLYWLLSESLLPTTNYWEFNQGIMDFGAIQCTYMKPKCFSCPFSTYCRHYHRNSLSRFF